MHSCAHKPQFLCSLLSVSLQEALALFGSLEPIFLMQMREAEPLLRSTAFQAGGKMYVIVNVTCLYLTYRVTLSQNDFSRCWQSVQKLRQAVECLLK